MQNLVKEFMEEYSCACGIENRYIDVVSEVGELGKEILKGTEYGKKEFKQRETCIEEMGDCLFSVFALCEEMDIDAREALNYAIHKYRNRMSITQQMGSGR